MRLSPSLRLVTSRGNRLNEQIRLSDRHIPWRTLVLSECSRSWRHLDSSDAALVRPAKVMHRLGGYTLA